ncbi:hypothetical protein [Sutcliffiella cohnii]|uniref:hypothetical protein n=1 Tax=Sutcliffiella cohnii TaxID=33932 RepID=UPI0008296325|nr:hypothetical protein [Sutcliffiella cohnii]
MAIYTIQGLLGGEQDIIHFYAEANGLWEEIWNNPQSESAEGLSVLLSNMQMRFENRCGGRYLGQEIMAWSGFGHLYDTGIGFNGTNQEKSNRLMNAFRRSSCSLEVKSHANRAAESYYVN